MSLPIYEMPGHLIRRIYQMSTAVFAAHMAREGEDITPVQFGALCAIRAHPGLDQGTVAGLIAYDRVTIGGVIDRLETKGLVERSISPSDRRARMLSLTQAGARLLARLEPIVFELQGEVLPGLDKAERALMMALMTKVVAESKASGRAALAAAASR